MNNIYLLYNFNNYYNRQLKRYDTLDEYLEAVGDDYMLLENVLNFNPADGVRTEHIFNFANGTAALKVNMPDYAVITDDEDTILQRWFILTTERTRGGQYRMSLMRDVVAECWNSIGNAPMFVEKAILGQNDPLILNNEGCNFNQIKKAEYRITDELNIPWIVGYMAQDNVQTETQSFLPNHVQAESYATLNDYPYYTYTSNFMKTDVIDDKYYVNAVGDSNKYQVEIDKQWGSYNLNGSNTTSLCVNNQGLIYRFINAFKSHFNDLHAAAESTAEIVSAAAAKAAKAERYKIIYITSAQKYYQVFFDKDNETISKRFATLSSTIGTAMNVAQLAANAEWAWLTNDVANQSSYQYEYTIERIKFKLVEVSGNDAITYKVPNTRNKLDDQPYSMFCMPYGYTSIMGYTGGSPSKDWSDISLQVAKHITAQFGGSSAALYDIQMLPYCPIRELIDNQMGLLDLTGRALDADYSYISQGETNIGIIFWATRSKASFDVNIPLTVSDRKIENETTFYRLVSPNYNGEFEFSAAKNGGVSGFNIDFTYKPYSPYIHVSPKFDLLYGRDFGDARGLICGGKFDLPQISDAWASYERSNANYSNIFNRQIDNLDVQQKYGRINDIASSIAGTIQGAGTGAAMGSVAGPMGAAVGAMVGGTASAVAGAADIYINDKLRQEQKDYLIDSTQLQLGNVRALPTSLTAVGSLTNNFKYFPFIEKYSCTEEEKAALIDRICYKGMTVGRIGRIEEFITIHWPSNSTGWNYFKGRLVRASIPNVDWNIVSALNLELNKGIYIKEVTS